MMQGVKFSNNFIKDNGGLNDFIGGGRSIRNHRIKKTNKKQNKHTKKEAKKTH